jgi:hypothetical protein
MTVNSDKPVDDGYSEWWNGQRRGQNAYGPSHRDAFNAGAQRQPGEGVEESLLARIQELRAENERLRAVVEATRTYVFGLPSSGSKYDGVVAALAALDGPEDG